MALSGVVVVGFSHAAVFAHQYRTMTMWYRADADLPTPTCSTESIGVQFCASLNATCSGGWNPIFGHTAEDPSVFVDTRGNWHMLVNALPGTPYRPQKRRAS